MKRYVKLLTALLAGAFLATACYEDKGNYDYSTTGDDILVYRMDTMKNVRLTWSYDEEIVIEPGYKILHERVSESDLAYEWSIDGEVVSEERILEIDPLRVGRHAGSFTVIDTGHEIRYSTIFTLVITSSFAEGWVILSDDGGQSLLSFINLVDASTPGELVRDVYGDVNGEALGSDPRKIRLVAYDGQPPFYEWEVLQGSGSVSIDQATMAKVADINTEFIGGAAPEGFVPVDGFQRDGGSILLSEDGKVYQRDFSFYNDYPVAHSGKYGTTPVYFDGGMEITLMNGFDHFTNKSYGHIPFALLYDRQNNRLLSVYGFNVKGNIASEFGTFRAVRIPEASAVQPGDTDPESGLAFPDVAALGDYTVEKMGARVAFSTTGVATTATNILLLKGKTDGKYYLLSFDYKMNSETSVAITLNWFRAMPEVEGFGAESLFEVCVAGIETVFFTAGTNNNTLYAYDLLEGTAAAVYTAPAQITSLCPGVVAFPNVLESILPYVKTNYKDRMLLGTESGQLVLLDISEEAVTAGSTPEIATFSGLGKVVDMDFYVAKNPYGYFGF